MHRGARIAAVGHGGQILLSDATAALVRDELPPGWRLHDLGEHRLKDFPAAARIHQLAFPGRPTDFPPLRAPTRVFRVPSPPGSLIGRDNDVTAQIGAATAHLAIGDLALAGGDRSRAAEHYREVIARRDAR